MHVFRQSEGGINQAMATAYQDDGQLLGRLAQSLDEPVYIVDATARIHFANPAARKLLDLDDSSAPHTLSQAFVQVPDQGMRWMKAVEAVHRTGYWQGELIIRGGNGDRRHLQATLVSDHDGPDAHFAVLARDLSAQQDWELELEAREARLERARAFSRVMVNRMSLDGSWRQVAPQFCELLDYSETDLLGRRFTDFSDKEESVYQERILQRMAVGELRHADLEKCYYRRDGEQVWVELSVTVVEDAGGEPVELYCYLVDITERRRADMALDYRRRSLELIAELSSRFISIGLGELDVAIHRALESIGRHAEVQRCYLLQYRDDGETAWCTHEWCATGVPPAIQDLQPVPPDAFRWLLDRQRTGVMLDIDHLDDLPPEAAMDRVGLEEQGIKSLLLCPLRIHDQLVGYVGFDVVTEPRQWSGDAKLLLSLAGQMLLHVMQRAEGLRTLAASEQRYRSMVENAVEAIIVFDLVSRRFVDANENALALFQVDRETLLSATPSDFLAQWQPGDPADDVTVEALFESLEEGSRRSVECVCCNTEADTFPAEVHVVRLPSGNGQALVRASIIDMSERRAAEQNLLNERYFTESAINSLPGIFYLLDEHFQVRRWNQRLEELAGMDRLRGLPSLIDCFVEADRAAVEVGLGRVMERGSGSIEGRLLDVRSGRRIPHVLTLRRVDAPDGLYLVGTGVDVSERLEQEQQRLNHLRRTRYQHEALGHIATSDAVAEGDLSAAFRLVTELGAAAMGVERCSVWLLREADALLECEDLYIASVGRHDQGGVLTRDEFSDYYENLRTGVAVDVDDAVNDPRTALLAETYLKPFGIESLLDSPILIAGRVVGVFSVESVDELRRWTPEEVSFVSSVAGQIAQAMINRERRRAQDALQESETRYRALYDHNPSMFFTVDINGFIRSVNSYAGETLGCPVEEFVGQPFDLLQSRQSRDAVDNHIRVALDADGDVHRWDAEFICADGTSLWARVTARAMSAMDDVPVVLAVCEDVTEARKLSEELSYQASHDALTGLCNRREFENRLKRALETSKSERVTHALMYMDLDQFKVINDTCGHIAGDELLRQLGEMLRALVSRRDTLSRLGGDEFGVLLEYCEPENARRLAESVRRAVSDFRFVWGQRSFGIGVSIGVVPISESSSSIDDVLSLADTACYAAKDQGRNRIHFYREDDSELARRHGEMQWVGRIRDALDDNRFELYAQPIAPLGNPALPGRHYEVLLRMRDEKGSLVMPGAFLPAAERFGLASRLDRWVVAATLAWLAGKPERLSGLNTCSINLSGHSFDEEEFLDFLLEQVSHGNVPPDKLCFEITETAAIRNLTAAAPFISRLKDLGCRFALDDFGSGLSSFAYLKNLPVDFLKIDGLFVKDIADDPIDFALVKSINEIGHVMGKQTIAEFVENDAILQLIREIGVDYAQGYGIGKPIPLSDI